MEANRQDIISGMGKYESPYGDIVYNWIMGFHRKINILELGSGIEGSFTRLLALCCKELGGKVLTFDKLDVRESNAKIDIIGLSPFVEFYRMDDLDKNTIEFVSNKRIKFDVLLIDTSHSYEATKQELETYSKLLSDDAIIILHDTSPKVNPSPYGTRKAVFEFLSQNLNYIVLNDLEGPEAGCMILKRFLK